MTPAERGAVVTEACARRGRLQSRACRYLGIQRGLLRYVARGRIPPALVRRLEELAGAKARWGSPRLTWRLQREGWDVNHKRVERLLRVGRLALLAAALLAILLGVPSTLSSRSYRAGCSAASCGRPTWSSGGPPGTDASAA